MTDLQVIGEESLDVWGKYWKLVQPYRKQLWNYCLRLTGSPWDAEDLLQDTVLKAFASLSALSHRQQQLNTKAYLFRVATNHWLDQCRRTERFKHEELNDEIWSEEYTDPLEITEAIYSLLNYLTPRQAVVFILMESFRFTAKEVAELLASTEGAVNGLLNRARKGLYEARESGTELKKEHVINAHAESIQAFIDAYNRKDYIGLVNMLLDQATFSFVEMNSKEYGKETIIKYSLNPNNVSKSHDIYAKSCNLFGKHAIIFIRQTEQGPILYDVNTMEWELNKIARWNCYYFCREFMQYVAKKLGLPLEDVEE